MTDASWVPCERNSRIFDMVAALVWFRVVHALAFDKLVLGGQIWKFDEVENEQAKGKSCDGSEEDSDIKGHDEEHEVESCGHHNHVDQSEQKSVATADSDVDDRGILRDYDSSLDCLKLGLHMTVLSQVTDAFNGEAKCECRCKTCNISTTAFRLEAFE